MKTERTKLGRIPSRGSHDPQAIFETLDDGYICHVAFVDQGQPFVIPTAYGRDHEYLYLHGSIKSRMLELLAAGQPCCITVTHLDALVLARSVFHHSMNYRSVVILGTCEDVTDHDEKMKGLEVITENILTGRWKEARLPNEGEMKATRVVKIALKEASLKVRDTPPKDDRPDYDLDIWAGLLPLKKGYENPVADPDLKPGIPMSPSVESVD